MKKWIAIILAILLVCTLTACGSEEVKETTLAETAVVNQEIPNATEEGQLSSAEDGSAYWGFYKMPEGFLEIYEDGIYEMMDFDGDVFQSGQCIFNDGLTLVNTNADKTFFVLDEDNNLYGGEDVGTYFRIGEDAPEDSPNGFLQETYVDRWYLFGDLSFHSLTIYTDGLWELRNPAAANGYIICEGFASPMENGDVQLFEKEGAEVGFLSATGTDLILVLTADFEWLLQDYLAGDLSFTREMESHTLEAQMQHDNSFSGYWEYNNGYILQICDGEWYLYEEGGKLIQSGPVEYENGEAYLMNADGSSGGGKMYMEENGETFVTGEKVIRLDAFPYGNTETP